MCAGDRRCTPTYFEESSGSICCIIEHLIPQGAYRKGGLQPGLLEQRYVESEGQAAFAPGWPCTK